MNGENNITKKTIFLVIGMLLTIFIFIVALTTLSSLGDTILIVFSVFLFVLFCYLGARLLTALSQQHLEKSKARYENEELKWYKTSLTSLSEFCNKVIQNNYTSKHNKTSCNSTAIDLFHLQKTVNNKGIFVTNIFAFEWSPNLANISEIEKKIYNTIMLSEKKLGAKMIRQRITIVCFFRNNLENGDIKNCISRFDYSFSPYLPVLVDIQNRKVYHAKIPSDSVSAKGKAFMDIKKTLEENLYNQNDSKV